MKITLGCKTSAIEKRALTIFSPCPTHLLVSEDAEMLKKVAFASLAIAFPMSVFPVPGGPNSRRPFGGALRPVKISGFNIGQTMISLIAFLAFSSPATSFHEIPSD